MPRYLITLEDRYGNEVERLEVGAASMALALLISDARLRGLDGKATTAVTERLEEGVVLDASPQAHEAEHSHERGRTHYRLGERGVPVCVYCGEELEL